MTLTIAEHHEGLPVLGVFLAALSAATFAFNNASARRGVLTGSVAQALAITVPIGVPIFLLAAVATGTLATLWRFSGDAIALLALAGVLHFVVGRYGNFRAAQAIGANLSGPVIQLSVALTLALAVLVLREPLTPLRILGIGLLVLAPLLMRETSETPAQESKPQASAAALASEASGQRGNSFGVRAHSASEDARERADDTRPEPGSSARAPKFVPRYAEGYAFALLAALVYGVTPFLIRLAVIRGDLGSGIAGGLVSYAAATVAVTLLLLLPGQWRHAREIKPESLKWFTYSGVSVSVAQMFIYMAYAVAPLTVVTPVLQLHHLLRLVFSRLLNPHHEIFGGRMILATALSLLGAVAIALDVEHVLAFLPLPESVAAFARWHWP